MQWGKSIDIKEACAKIIMDIAKGVLPAVTDSEVLQEILYRYWHIKQLEKGLQVFADFERLMPTILSISRNDLTGAAQILLAHPQLAPRDALHIAVMKNNDIDTIYSTDTDFDIIGEIKRVDPLKL